MQKKKKKMGKLEATGEDKDIKIWFGEKHEHVFLFCDLVYFYTIYFLICDCWSKLYCLSKVVLPESRGSSAFLTNLTPKISEDNMQTAECFF